jgi:glycosyltransferase involved in cell wall biosynthesis
MGKVAFIDYFPTHYRRRMYEEVGRRLDADFYFFADARERYWNRNIPLSEQGDYRRVDLPRFRVAGEAVMPGVARRLARGDYSAVIKSLNGKLMLPLTYGSAWIGRVPFVLWTGMWYHPTTPLHRLSKPATEAIYRGSAAIVGYGDHVRRFVLETPGVDAAKVFVAGQAVERERFAEVSPRFDGEGEAEVLYVGQFEERKGLRYLLEAFDALNGAPARLRLVGNGSQEDWLRREAASRSNVDIVGYRPQEALPGEFARSRCLVLPSITTRLDREPWGLVLNEAMHAGLPVIATDAVGAAVGGLVADGRTGYVVPERSSAGLADAIRSLVERPGQAREMGEAARKAAGSFDYERMASAFQSAVEYALRTRRR